MQRIRTRLIVAFVCVALLPAVPLSLVVRNLIDRSFSPALDPSLEEAITAGLDDSRERLRAEMKDFAAAVEAWRPRPGAETIVWLGPSDPTAAAELRQWAAGRPAPGVVERVGGVLAAAAEGNGVILARALPPKMAGRAARMTEGLSLLRMLRQERGAVLRSYVVSFLLVYGVLIAIAVALGAVLARRLARPVEALAAATGKVAEGDLETRVGGEWGGEVGHLVAAFDRMVDRLAVQRREVARLERVAAWRDLARTLAHEIKNPLTPILLAVQQLRDAYDGEDETYRRTLDDCTDIVREEVDGLRDLVAEFSDFARLPRPKPEPGDLRPLLLDVQRLYGPDRLGCETEGDALPADIDSAQLRRALINLIDNALTASGESKARPPVVIACRPDPLRAGGWLLSVRDEGRGIAPENIARIFEPNFSTRKEGMGLGLPTVENIVAGHGGRIAVTSEPGRGTEFTIMLPAPAGGKETR